MPDTRTMKQETQEILMGNAAKLVEVAQKIADEMMKDRKVTTSQLRNLYGTAKKIEARLNKSNAKQLYNELILLKPKMAYINGRFNEKRKDGSWSVPGLYLLDQYLSTAIDEIAGDFNKTKNFFKFFEAILAYHKAKGGD